MNRTTDSGAPARRSRTLVWLLICLFVAGGALVGSLPRLLQMLETQHAEVTTWSDPDTDQETNIRWYALIRETKVRNAFGKEIESEVKVIYLVAAVTRSSSVTSLSAGMTGSGEEDCSADLAITTDQEVLAVQFKADGKTARIGTYSFDLLAGNGFFVGSGGKAAQVQLPPTIGTEAELDLWLRQYVGRLGDRLWGLD